MSCLDHRKRVRRAFALTAAFWFFPMLCSANGPGPSFPHVQILGFANEEGSSELAAASSAASSALDLTMRQLQGYEILPPLKGARSLELDALRELAAQREADFLLFGKIGAEGAGHYACELSLFDRAKGAVSISRRSGGLSALELFDATDELIAQVLGEMTGRHIGFGRLELRNRGEKADYQVFLDGMDLGKNLASLGSLLAGEHRIRLAQQRILGEYVLLDRAIQVEEGGSAECEFSAPAITEEERAKLEGLESEARSGWYRPELAEVVDEKVQSLGKMAREARYSSAFDAYRLRALQLAGEWRVVRNRAEIEARAWEPDSSLFDPSMAAYLEASRYRDPEAIKALAKDNALLLAEFLELRAGKELGEGKARAALKDLEGILEFSRCLPAEYRSAYTFAASKLAEIMRTEGDEPAQDKLEATFLPSMEAATAFYSQRPKYGEKIILSSRHGLGICSERNKVPSAFVSLSAGQQAATIAYEGEGLGGSIDIKADDRRFALIDFGPTSFGLASIPPHHPGLAGKAGEGYCSISVQNGPEQAEKTTIRILAEEGGIERARGSNRLSALLPPGRYEIVASLEGDEGVGYREIVELKDEPKMSVDLPKLSWSKDHEKEMLERERDELLAKKQGMPSPKKYGYYALGSVGAIVAASILGPIVGPMMGEAYTSYMAATSADEAVSYRRQTEWLRAATYSLVACGIGGIGSGFYFLARWDHASSSEKSLNRQIESIDEKIRRFSAKD